MFATRGITVIYVTLPSNFQVLRSRFQGLGDLPIYFQDLSVQDSPLPLELQNLNQISCEMVPSMIDLVHKMEEPFEALMAELSVTDYYESRGLPQPDRFVLISEAPWIFTHHPTRLTRKPRHEPTLAHEPAFGSSSKPKTRGKKNLLSFLLKTFFIAISITPKSGCEQMSGAGLPDFFCREAQRLGYVARSAFKLLQIQKQFKIIKPGASILDLGCAPGAWLQVACQNLGPLNKGGTVIGIDVKKVKVPSAYCDERVQTVCGDVMKLMSGQLRALSPQGKGYSVILSDMCPPVSGIHTKDTALSCELGTRALTLALGEIDLEDANNASSTLKDEEAHGYAQCDACEGMLQLRGSLVIKFLECEESQGFPKFCKKHFRKVSWLRPKATRSSSREIYLICQDLR